MWLEGFEEPLHVTVSKGIPESEFKELSTEILRNYILDLKDKGAISKEMENVIIISKDDLQEVAHADVHMLDRFTKIVIGFSGVERLRNEFTKNKAMNELNAQLVNKSYRHVEESLNISRAHHDPIGNKENKQDGYELFAQQSQKRDNFSTSLIETTPKIKQSNYPKTSSYYLQPLQEGLAINQLCEVFFSHPLSFGYMYKEKPFKNLLMPVFLPLERIRKQPPTTKEELFRDQEKQSNGELKLINAEIIESQSGILGEVIKKAMKAFFTGQGLVGMSLPIKIFEPRSTLQRITDNFCYITTFLKKANDATDPLERAKYCLTCLISGICMSGSQKKPFNPYLGETLEAEFSDGSKLYMEHTSHHPPISNFYIATSYGAKVHGRFEQVADMGANSMDIIYRGPLNIQFSDGKRVTLFYPVAHTTGVVWSSRTFRFDKRGCFVDPENQIKGYFEMGEILKGGKYKSKRADTFAGEIFTYDPAKHKGYGENFKAVQDAFKAKDKVKLLSTIDGGLLESVDFNGVEYWSFDAHKVERALPIENPIPSDFRFREDLVWLEYGNKEQAQEWKLKLEEIQRWDRALRQEAEKKRKKGK
jgi:hypothetical protein